MRKRSSKRDSFASTRIPTNTSLLTPSTASFSEEGEEDDEENEDEVEDDDLDQVDGSL